MHTYFKQYRCIRWARHQHNDLINHEKVIHVDSAESQVSMGPRSVTRILGLFETLAKAVDGLSLAELSVTLESPKSSLLTLLRPLVAEGYLSHGSNRYRLGPFIYRLAGDILATRNFPKLMRPYLEELAVKSGESVYLSVIDMESQMVTHIDGIDSQNPVRYVSPLGAPRPLHCTAPGRLLLAYQDERTQDAYLKSAKLKAMTWRTITDRSTLKKQLKEIRETGVSISISELSEGAAGIAVPVHNTDGTVAAALVIAAPAERMQHKLNELRELLISVGTAASGLLGHA
ncbi:IclR family transcriptional regulator [Pseudomonas sp. SJZ103]|nr:IclR family transcriptional regulator [Pseudomonas sp. SJZ103]TWC78796.1 IclR family transcriptional regulator [Pseudomonas sp. SJZ094]